MKKVFCLLLLASLCVPAFALGEAAAMPRDMLPVLDVQLEKGYLYDVYSGPPADSDSKNNYQRSGNGKAVVSTNDWVQVFGAEDLGIMVQYGVGKNRQRIGYLYWYDVKNAPQDLPSLTWDWSFAHTTKKVSVTDDPFCSRAETAQIAKGVSLQVLKIIGEWAYVDCVTFRGFVPAGALQMDPVPVQSYERYAGAVAFLQAAGVEFEVTGLHERDLHHHLYFSLKNGGTGRYYGVNNPFDLLDWRGWYFYDISDGDIEKLLDARFAVLASIEAGLSPEEYYQYGYLGEQGKRNIQAVVSNGLSLGSENEEQWLQVLLQQLSFHDGQDAINSLRARAASRLLGFMDITPVPAEAGCAWYDALTLRKQDTLPEVDVSIYENDPLLCEALDAVIDAAQAANAGYTNKHIDKEKGCRLAALSVCERTENNGILTLWVNVSEGAFALFDGEAAYLYGGSYSPWKLTRDKSGVWTAEQMEVPEDSRDYPAAILRFCQGNRQLVKKMDDTPYPNLLDCFRQYLTCHGYGDVSML